MFTIALPSAMLFKNFAMQTGHINLPALSQSPRRSRASWVAILSVAILLFLGFFVPLVLSDLLASHILLASRGLFVLILFFPALLGTAIWFFPKVWGKFQAIRIRLRWWHWLWVLAYLSSQVYVHTTDAASDMPSGATILARLGPEAIIFAILVFNLNNQGVVWVRQLFRGLLGVMTIYTLICVASTIWSVFPLWTLFKSLEYMLDMSVLAAALANVVVIEDYFSVFNWVLTICCLETAWVCMQVPIFPTEAFLEDNRLKGAFPLVSYNAVGQAGAILAVIAVCRLAYIPGARKPDRGFYSLLFLFGTATMILAQTRSAVGGFVLAVPLVLLFSRPILAFVVGGLSAMLLAIGAVSGVLMEYLLRGQNENSLHEMTGREYFWSYSWEQFKLHPIGGLGAYAAGRFIVQEKLHIFTATLHSDWIELMVGVGIMGMIPMILALFGAWWYLFRGIKSRFLTPQERQISLEALGILCVITAHSFFNDELIWHVPLYYMVVLGYAELVRRRLKAARRAGAPDFATPASWQTPQLAIHRQTSY